VPESPFVRVRVSGPLACFSRPEMKVERVSYEVMTPSAARGVLDAILWRPEMKWQIRRIEVLRPIRFLSVRRNEIQDKVAPRSIARWMADPSTYEPQPAGAGSEAATPRTTLALRDVAYVIEAMPYVHEPNDQNHSTKYLEMFQRRVAKGQCFHRPYLGCREFACEFEPPANGERPIDDSCDLGLMLYDIAFGADGAENRAVFFHARLVRGVLDTHPEHAIPDVGQRQELLACSSKR
jgi:CRISPR-associated protein Cas5d